MLSEFITFLVVGGVGAERTDASHSWQPAERAAWSWTLHGCSHRLHCAGPGWSSSTYCTRISCICGPEWALRPHMRMHWSFIPDDWQHLCCLGDRRRGWQSDPGAVSPQGHWSWLHGSRSYRGSLVRLNPITNTGDDYQLVFLYSINHSIKLFIKLFMQNTQLFIYKLYGVKALEKKGLLKNQNYCLAHLCPYILGVLLIH